MKIDGFKNRYIIKVASSIVIAALNIVIQLILPRALSIEEFGYYSYNLNVFTSVVVMLNLSTSDAMVSKFSKRNQEIGLVCFYLKFYTVVSVLLCVGITLLFPTRFVQSTFAGQTLIVVLLGLLTAIVTKLLTDAICMYDAFAVSRFPAVMNILLKIVVSGFVMVAYFLGRLNLHVFYISQVIVIGIVVTILLVAIIKEQSRRYPNEQNKTDTEYLKEYVTYCKPLAVASIINQIVIIVMNWALMHWSGASETALFGAAWQLNTLVGYVFSPYAELSKREFAVLYKDREQLKVRFDQALRLMFWVTSYFALFIGIEADWFLLVIYGDKYSGAYLVTLLIMYYTVFQAWGQITGSLMLGMEYTKMSAAFSILGQIFTLAFVFLFQMPNFIWPNGLGAVGIALNYLVACLLSTLLRVAVICRKLQMKVLGEVAIPLLPLLICSVVPLFLKLFFNNLILSDSLTGNIGKILISGIVYSLFIGLIVWNNPALVGTTKESILSLFRRKKN